MSDSNLKVIAGGRVIDPSSNLDCKADIHIKDGKIIQKLTYSKTIIDIDGKAFSLSVSDK